jgi:hypothetical protein
MSSYREVTPDIIRDEALKILSEHRGGIRQSDLFKMTEAKVAFAYSVSEHSVKNALWDIAEKYPQFVEKKKISSRKVVLLPTDELIGKYDTLKTAAKAAADVVKEYPEIAFALTGRLLAHKFMDIMRYIELSEIDQFLELTKMDYEHMTVQEIEATYGIKHALEQLRNYRNMIAHGLYLR